MSSSSFIRHPAPQEAITRLRSCSAPTRHEGTQRKMLATAQAALALRQDISSGAARPMVRKHDRSDARCLGRMPLGPRSPRYNCHRVGERGPSLGSLRLLHFTHAHPPLARALRQHRVG